ncbi:MAG: ChaN family lipoprotein, partial [Candidatus Aminicenantes bacterium]|nr:ChaN family lipoprotein [Candidatus Aminicenantes bacterium]
MTMTKRGVLSIVILASFAAVAGAQGQTQPPTQAAAAQAQAQDQAQAATDKPDLTMTLKIGNPKLKDKTMEVGPGAVLSGETGAAIDFERMIRDMMTSRIVHVGESHDSMPMHELQFQVIRALYARDKHLAVGLEMLPVTVQEALNKWTAGILT